SFYHWWRVCIECRSQEPVENTRPNARFRSAADLLDQPEESFDMLASQRRRDQYWRIIKEEKPFARCIYNFFNPVAGTAFWLNKIELVRHNDGRLTRFLGQSSDLLVLRGDAAG